MRSLFICLSIFVIITSGIGLIFASDYSNPKSETQYNVILVSIDTLRADHLGCYGYSRDTSPNIDKFAKETILFENAFSQGNATMSSHASIFTSQYPTRHRVIDIVPNGLMDQSLTLAEALKENGYRTVAFTGGGHLHSRFGFNQGFNEYYDGGEANKFSGSFKNNIPLCLEWIEKNKGKRFFLFLHGYDVHMPFEHPNDYIHFFDSDYKGLIDSLGNYHYLRENVQDDYYISTANTLQKITERDKSHLIAHYDGSIRYADSWLGKFFGRISELQLLDKTIIVILSDHGEELFDHGRIFWHGGGYDEIIHTLLIIRHPEVKKTFRVKQQVQLIDIMPTILDFLNLPIPSTTQGKSLKNIFSTINEEGKEPLPLHDEIYSDINVIRTPEWKLVGRLLFNLRIDPEELDDLRRQEPLIYLKLYKKITQWRKDNDKIEIPFSENTRKQLKRLGYW